MITFPEQERGDQFYTLQDFEPSESAKLGATISEMWQESYFTKFSDALTSSVWLGMDNAERLADPDAEAFAKSLGGFVKPEDVRGGLTKAQIALKSERQRELLAVKDLRERTPWDGMSVVRGAAMFATGIADPINLATAFVPWTRAFGAMSSVRTLAASGSIGGRALGRFAVGAADGGISTLALEPAFYAASQYLGDDYDAVDSMANIAFGAAFGGGIHTIGGAGVDAYRAFSRSKAAAAADAAVPAAPVVPEGAVSGAETQIKVGDAYEPARWTVVEADQLQAQVDKADNQFRDRTRAAYQTEIQQRANNIDFNLLGESPVMDLGAPTLAADGRIIGGNGRALFISRAYEIGNGDAYRQPLETKLADLGIDVDAVRSLKKPVLVRVLQREVDVKQAAMLSNEGGSSAMSPLEQAKVDAERLGDARLDTDADGSLNTATNRGAVRRWVNNQPENQRNALMAEDGSLSAAGLQRLRNAVLFKAYGDSPVLSRLIEATDVGSRNVASALVRSVGSVADARAAIARGELFALDIADDIRMAVEQFDTLRRAGTAVSDYLAQMDAFGDPLSPVARLMLSALDRNIASSRRIADIITNYYDAVVRSGSPAQGDMFGATVPDPLQLLDDAIRAAEGTVDSAAEIAASVSPQTREAALVGSLAQTTDGRFVEVDAVLRSDPAVGTATMADVQAGMQANGQVSALRTADLDASAQMDAEIATAPKSYSLLEAEQADADADALLNDVIAAGDQAFKYSRDNKEINAASDAFGLTEALRLSFGADTDALIARGQVQIVNTPADIPGGPHPEDVKAATAPDGTVYVVAENVSESEARGIVLHEVGVHVGMREMLGDDLFGSVLSELDDAIMRGEDWALRARSAVPAETLPAHVREEQLAYLVQNAPELPIVQRIIAAVRAWAYRNFEVARQNLTLTEADFRAMAVAALHEVARRGEDAVPTEFAYSRGPTQDPAPTRDELKASAEQVKRAKSTAAALRAAADKLDNDAQAVAAMRAAMPDLTKVEIDDLLAQLRAQVKGLRSSVRGMRDSLAAEDAAVTMQSEAMKAADQMANNIELASVIEARNAKLNAAARLRAQTFVQQFDKPGLDAEGFMALLVGSERLRTGSRVSVDSEYKGFRSAWTGGLIADVEKLGLMKEFASGLFDREIYDALYRIGSDLPLTGIPADALKLAEVVNKYQQASRLTRNRFGAWIRDLKGYITRQSHDMFKIRDAGPGEWVSFVLPKLDLEKMERLGLIDAADPQRSLEYIYDDFAAGVHMKAKAGEDDLVAFGRGSNLAKRESVSRTLYFKDGVAAFEYNQRFGVGRLADSVLTALDQSARSAALLKTLGTNPEAMITRLMDEYEEGLRGNPERRAEFHGKRGSIMNALAQVTGEVNIPGDVKWAKRWAFARSWQSMAKLGGALISSVTDLAGYAAEVRYGQGKNLLAGVADSIGSLVKGRAAGEREDMLVSLGVFHESVVGSVMNRFDNPDLIGGKTAYFMNQFFKLNGLNWWTETLRDGAALSYSRFVGNNTGKRWDALPDELRQMLELYKIDAGKWDIVRMAVFKDKGETFLSGDQLRTVPRAAFENYITSVGRVVNDASVQNLQDDLAQALRVLFIDRAHHAVIEPNARVRAFMLRGTQPGTVGGELLRFIGQFKSFSVAMVQMTLGREVYGRGYDTVGEYLKNGKGDMVGLATYIGLATMLGYGAMAAKDLIKGREPRSPADYRTWMAAMVQGGGLGIYGDFLFGEYNRMGRTFTASMAGPVLGQADTLLDLWTRARNGDDLAGASVKAFIDNTPFANLFYTRIALDYLILYGIQEALNPGFLRRMEQRVRSQNDQEYLFPPSQNAFQPF